MTDNYIEDQRQAWERAERIKEEIIARTRHLEIATNVRYDAGFPQVVLRAAFFFLGDAYYCQFEVPHEHDGDKFFNFLAGRISHKIGRQLFLPPRVND